MERRKALAAATSATLALGTGIVALSAVAGISILGFGGRAAHADDPTGATTPAATQTRVVVRTRNVYDRQVVDTGTDATAQEASEPAGATPPFDAARIVAAPTSTSTSSPVNTADPESPTTNPPTGRRSSASTTTTPTTSRSTTTVPATTTTVRPRGVPPDWPPGTPVPPVPPNCREQRLGLDGVWHCDH